MIVTERGFSFGYNNLVVDMRAFPILRALGYPVVYDVTHSLQLPGAGDGVTAGQAEFIEPMASRRRRAGVDGVFMEVHEEPARAKSDAQNALRLDLLPDRCSTGWSGFTPSLASRRAVTAASRHERQDTTTRRSSSPEGAADRGGRDRSAWSIASTATSSARSTCSTSAAAASSSPAWASPGIICRKIAATLSSTGTSAWFLHPAEAIHGDLGAIREDDVVMALSHSGETEELVRLLESIRRIGARLIALTGSPALDARRGRPTSRSTAASPRKRAR